MQKITETELNKFISKHVNTLYSYGSRVYGTNTDESDYDQIAVVDDECTDYIDDNQIECEYSNGHIFQFTIYTKSEFDKKLANCDVDALECYFLNNDQKLIYVDKNKAYDYKLELDREKVYRNFSQAASNSWVKCKKKLEVEHDYRVGKKSLWHSLRILEFAKQILSYGKITEYDSEYYKMLYHEIVDNDFTDYNLFKVKYQELYNELKGLVKRKFYCSDYLLPINCSKCDLKNEFCQQCRKERQKIDDEAKVWVDMLNKTEK